MRFLLINPFYPIAENPSPPLGLAYLAAALDRAGIEVRVLDLVVHPYSPAKLETLLSEFQPHLAGATAVTMSFNHAARVLADIKRLSPEIFTVMGGPHVTFRGPETMRENPAIDFIVLGEGDEAVVQLAQAVERGGGFCHIDGLIYRDNGREDSCEPGRKSEGRVVETAPRLPGLDVDALPVPAREFLPLGRYRALNMAISMTTSRGCPYQCIFCVGRKMVGAKVRYRNPIGVVDELAELSSLGFHQINIADDLFTANKKHCLDVCDEILKRGLEVKWTSFARVDTVSPDLLSRMAEAGCSAVSFGVESGSREILRIIKKGINPEQVEAAARMCVDAGVTPHASFILGLPGETPDTLKETLEFGRRLKDMGVSHGFHILAPFPGTKVREEAERYGLKILTHDWDEYHANRAITETESVTKKMVDEIVIGWENEFDAYLGYIQEGITSGTATDEVAWPLVNLERIVLIYELMMREIIETTGTWEGIENDSSGPGDHFERLVKQVSTRLNGIDGINKNRLMETLDDAWKRGNLECLMLDNQIDWKWVDYIV